MRAFQQMSIKKGDIEADKYVDPAYPAYRHLSDSRALWKHTIIWSTARHANDAEDVNEAVIYTREKNVRI